MQNIRNYSHSVEFYPPRDMKCIPSEETRKLMAEAQIKNEYYKAGGIEVIDYIKAKLTPEQYKGYLLGNVIKYSSRLNFKGESKRDAKKLADYGKWLEEISNGT